MRNALSRRSRVLALFLACTAAPFANAQLESPPLSSAVEGPRTLDMLELEPVSGEPTEAPAPPETTPRPPSFPKMVLLDVGHVFASPFRWSGRDWLLVSASAAGVATLSLADQSLSDAAREHGPTFGFVGDAFEGLGDGRSFVLLGGFYLVGLIGHDSKAKNVFFDGLSASLIASGMITPLVSTLVGRERPTAEQGAYSFHPFEGRSFPSGHTTQAFAVASVIATSYDQLWVKVAAYGAATVTAYMRVQRGKHFATDVLVGAVIGTAVGRSVVHFNTRLRSGEKEPEGRGVDLTIVPNVGSGTYGLTATVSF